VTVRTIGTSRYHELVSMSDDDFGWVAEGGTRNETATPTLRDREPTMGTAYALPKASEESLDDIFFDVRGWLTENAGDAIAAGEAVAIVSGDGTAKPTGFLNTSPVTTTDDASPLRDADALMYVPGLAGSPAALSADALIDLATASLKERYLIGESVAWVMNRSALSQARQLKDSSGRYIWSESLTPGVPGTLLGFPVYTSDAMPAVGTDNFPIAFGNWRRGYVLVDRVGMRITVDEVTTPGQVRYYVRRRVGGIIRNNDALRVVKWAAS
jgi:HK97 family phage major capsid protein